MNLDQLLALNVVLIAAVASPGPALMHAMRSTLTDGRAAGVVTGFGLACTASAWTFLSLLGVGRLVTEERLLHAGLCILGSGYLFYVAVATWRDAERLLAMRSTARARNSFFSGVLLNMSNPKVLILSSAVLVSLFPLPLPITPQMVIMTNHFCVEMVFYTGVALAIGTPRFVRVYASAKRLLDRVVAVCLTGLSLSLLAQSVH